MAVYEHRRWDFHDGRVAALEAGKGEPDDGVLVVLGHDDREVVFQEENPCSARRSS